MAPTIGPMRLDEPDVSIFESVLVLGESDTSLPEGFVAVGIVVGAM